MRKLSVSLWGSMILLPRIYTIHSMDEVDSSHLARAKIALSFWVTRHAWKRSGRRATSRLRGNARRQVNVEDCAKADDVPCRSAV